MVLEAVLRLLANPMFLRMAIMLLACGAAFVAGIAVMRVLRRRLVEDEMASAELSPDEAIYSFSAVIQQLKQQKFELQHEQQEQQRRAKTSEHVTALVIANLPCGVLFVAPNGLVRQANAAAKRILGFASPLGMSVQELLRNARGASKPGAPVKIADVIKNGLLGHGCDTDLEFSYEMPAGESKSLNLTLIPLHAPSGEAMGLAAIIMDQSATASQRRESVLRSEIAAEMAMELHTSLATIRACVSQLAGTQDRQFARNLANDIAVETERLGRAVGGFLAGRSEERALSAKA